MTIRLKIVNLWLWLTPLAVLFGAAAGIRSFGIGPDYANYLAVYDELRPIDSLADFRFEPGFVLATRIAKFALEWEFPLFLGTLAAASLLVKCWLFGQSRYPVPTLLFYLCCWFPYHEYTQIRIAVALACCLLAAECYFRGHLIAFAALSVLAASFHASVLIAAGLLPLAHLLAGFRLLPVVTGIAVLSLVGAGLAALFVAVAAQVNMLVEGYVSNLQGHQVNLLSGVNLLTAALLVAICLAGHLETRREATLFLMVIFGLAAALALQGVPVLSHRIKEMLLVFLVPLSFCGILQIRALPQYALACALAGWSLHSALSQGVIGVGG